MDLNDMANALTASSSRQTEWSAHFHTVGVIISALAIGLVSSHFVSETIGEWLAIAGSTIIGTGLWLGRHAQGINWRARFLRRRALLADSLGYSHALREGLDVATDVLDSAEIWSASSAQSGAYYASQQPVGVERLRENLVESAAWTEKLCRISAAKALGRAVVVLVIAIGMAAAVAMVRTGALDGTAVLQLFSVALVFVVSADQFDAVVKWRWAAAETRRARDTASSAEADGLGNIAVVQIWVAFADYAVVTTVAPAIPRDVYERYRRELEALSATLSRQSANKLGTGVPG